MPEFFTKLLSHLHGRKFAGLMVVVVSLLVAGWTMDPSKLPAVTLALAGSYTTFVAGHSYTDAQANKAVAAGAK